MQNYDLDGIILTGEVISKIQYYLEENFLFKPIPGGLEIMTASGKEATLTVTEFKEDIESNEYLLEKLIKAEYVYENHYAEYDGRFGAMSYSETTIHWRDVPDDSWLWDYIEYKTDSLKQAA